MPKYSIVVPFHNEQESVTALYDRLKAVMEGTGETFELVFVDDGSIDRTYKLLREIVAVDSRVVVVKLRRNFGQTSALAAGFAHSQGEYLIAMDGDLQHDPEEIPKFLEMLEQGYDLVSGWRKERVDNFVMRRIPSRIANWAMAKLSGVNIHDFGTTFLPSQIGHVAIYVGNGWIVHAYDRGVSLEPMTGWLDTSFAWGRSPLTEAGLE